MTKLRCNDRERRLGQSTYVMCVECGAGPCLENELRARETGEQYEAKLRRNRIAEVMLAALVAGHGTMSLDEELIIDQAVNLADALIAELDK